MFDLRDKDPRTLTAIDDAIKHPQRYVLKPQKEGGGNNIFGEEISEKLLAENYEQFLLMRWIDAPVMKTYMLRKGELAYVDSITELGVFSLVLADSRAGKVWYN